MSNDAHQLPKSRRATVLLGHGSRVPQASSEFDKLHEKVQALFEPEPVFIGYIELAKPSLEEALTSAAKAADSVVLVPIQLGAASHVKNDIPLAIAKVQGLFPKVKFTSLGAIGDHPLLLDLCEKRLSPFFTETNTKDTSLLFLGRGSSDPDANAFFFRVMRLVAERLGLPFHMGGFVGITQPSFKDALTFLARTRPKKLVVMPYFLFYGVLMERIKNEMTQFQKSYPWIKLELAEYLGPDDLLARYVYEKVGSLENKKVEPLPCLTCHYRVPAKKVVDNVDGLSALLWSVRHSLTHQDSMPHEHAHAPLKKHILVCTNADCAKKGSMKVLGGLRRQLKQKKLHKEYKVTRTLCMGRCGEGPCVAVYPDGVWYREFGFEDCEGLVDNHLLSGKLLSSRVDHVMQ